MGVDQNVSINPSSQIIIFSNISSWVSGTAPNSFGQNVGGNTPKLPLP